MFFATPHVYNEVSTGTTLGDADFLSETGVVDAPSAEARSLQDISTNFPDKVFVMSSIVVSNDNTCLAAVAVEAANPSTPETDLLDWSLAL